MSLSTMKPVACRIPLVVGANGFPSEVAKVRMVDKQTLPALEVKQMEQPLLLQSTNTSSRREMMHLTAASLVSIALFFPDLAEARPRNLTMKQKIMEKLEQLKQKAGLSKPGDGGEEKKPDGKDKPHKSKLSSETTGNNLKSENDDEGKKPGKEYPAKAAEKEPSLPMLPNLSLPMFRNGGSVEPPVS